MSINTARRHCAIATTSWLALSVALGGTAFAQTAAPEAPEGANMVDELIVVGARASQQSANARKKNATTAVDSIVADDVGSFPDKNLNEALSRVAGVALNRDEFGDGTSVTLRGNSAENIRVEVDGMGVGGGGMSNTRSAELTVLPADLIKSVDVIKGSTASMTEGGLGGSVQVTTRTGLDFKKPYFSVRLGGRTNSLSTGKINPDINLVGSRKFFDDRLGVLLSVSAIRNENITNGIDNNNYPAGYQSRLVDFDNSLEKTWEYNPATVASPVGENRQNIAVDTVMANSVFTPRQIVTMSANAKTKGDCLTSFPFLTLPAVPTAAQNNQANRRIAEQQTCLSQWNDYLPNLMRFFEHTQLDERVSADLRFDYRVSDNLTLFVRGQKSDRTVERLFRTRNTGGDGGNFQLVGSNAAANTQYDANTNPNGLYNVVTDVNGVQTRVLAPNNPLTPTVNKNVFIIPGVLQAYNNRPIYGSVSNVDPASVKVDENHFVTEFVAQNQSLGFEARYEPFNYYTTFLQAGGEWDSGNLNMKFMVGKSMTDYDRIGTYAQRSFRYGEARVFVQPSGLWAALPTVDFDETDPNNYVQLTTPGASLEVIRSANGFGFQNYTPAYSVAQRAQVTPQTGVQYNVNVSETEETTAKFDLVYNFDDSQPVFTKFSAGINQRNWSNAAWNNPGGGLIKSGSPDSAYYLQQPNLATPDPLDTIPQRDANNAPIRNPAYVAPIVLPRALVRSNIRACVEATEPTPGNPTVLRPVAGRESCNFGYQANLNPYENRDGLLTVTPDELRQLTLDSFLPPSSKFFNGYPGTEGLMSWQGIDSLQLTALFPTTNFDCVKVCTANDGQVYEQPFSAVEEKITAAYAQMDFEQDLPWNMMVNGNVGVRGVFADVSGTGRLTVNAIRTTSSFNPATPGTAAGITTVSVSQNTSISKSTRDFLPSFNMALWVLPDTLALRYYKGKNVSRPGIGNLLPNGTCTVDQRADDPALDFDDSCGRIGNPALKPLTAYNQNISIEWYPNRDTQLSYATFIQDEKIGAPQGSTVSEFLLAGRGLTDPATGEPLDDVLFTYPSWTNGPGIKREGWEVSAKTAFTFLPWYFRNLGADFNYSKVKSKSNSGASRVHPFTGEVLPPSGQPEFFANLSLWYDDGRTMARITAQKKAQVYDTNEGDTAGNNTRNVYQYPGSINPRDFGLDAPWQPGYPIYTDETLFVDAKVSFKIRPDLEIYAEARNLRKEANVSSSGGMSPAFADGTPYLNSVRYGGQHFGVGLVYRYGGE